MIKDKLMIAGLSVIILVILVLTTSKNNITGMAAVDFADKIEVISAPTDMECSGTNADPCLAEIKFKALEDFKAEPREMIKIKGELERLETQEGYYSFQKNHVYTLLYRAYKKNPNDAIEWSWGPIK